uniref:Semaphorin-1A n=1 Tax=Lepisosteus oculatus TaxID=7918 RepID=W5MHU8_LEPOC|nr:PREDICTED: semaphorin-4E-like [Lepisosteus oculatus]XP_015221016.1 PREDICTED: semaphorin-4E-like [Lepisosteus oculatus]XP_015221017.1 PREDICTED: semaphorin-4E-like [Lepisosteus oculatus]XP_015221018.1 PREDICTED: semaphorin-4E-like [Lepisosteus oculatus]XP_015221019.1 PREDICTED: semaphorin-4E-like [Lepisosteus oculatus]XP_015221020.1 PREDICTED: semaphorin-4E-like [Lepisosteus oculatus]XP_015221021.1 PREDICTED: semaphorin-4E-like [Lepisosteus oculatus]XP_015221022.1 PREDICTED: semaphorin-4E
MSPPAGLQPLLCLLCLLARDTAGSPHCIPRKSVLYHNGNIKLFREEGISNYTTMLLREDLGLLIVGAREAIYALDMGDIFRKKSNVTWQVISDKQRDCVNKGKDAETECRNYIRTLHKIDDDNMYVCGTDAFSPTCDVLVYRDGKLQLKNKKEEGKGKCPFDPFQRYSSVMVDGDLYCATAINFLGSEPAVLRSSPSALRTEFKSSWLNEPNFVYMDVVPESRGNAEGDDDKVYLFFSESAVEYDFFSKLPVSRVARVCKGDLGGQRTLQKKWTSFLKARLDCSAPGHSLPFVVQDVFLLHSADWRESIFYAVFVPQSGLLDVSAVCAYRVADVSQVFSHGKYKTPVTVESSHVKWVMYSGEVPVPRPGACINNATRAMGMQQSLDLPDKTLQFIRDRPLMDDAVAPLGGQPQLVKKGAQLTRIAVDRVTVLDGRSYHVMFIGTVNGYLQKAVNFDGEMFIIEEVQLFHPPEPIKTMRLSAPKGQLYVGSESGVVQVPLSVCSRYETCLDCVLARDPYCAWDLRTALCTAIPRSATASHTDLIQSVRDGDASRCPKSGTVRLENCTLIPGNNIKLQCQPGSNLAEVKWRFQDRLIPNSDSKYYIYSDGMLIFNASAADAGDYTCQSVEQVNGRQYPLTMAVYKLLPRRDTDELSPLTTPAGSYLPRDTSILNNSQSASQDPKLPLPRVREQTLVALQVAVALLTTLLAALLMWNLYRGHISMQCCKGAAQGRAKSSLRPRQLSGGQVDSTAHQVPFTPKGLPEATSLVQGYNDNTNNNRGRTAVATNGASTRPPTVLLSPLDDLKFIDDESEI